MLLPRVRLSPAASSSLPSVLRSDERSGDSSWKRSDRGPVTVLRQILRLFAGTPISLDHPSQHSKDVVVLCSVNEATHREVGEKRRRRGMSTTTQGARDALATSTTGLLWPSQLRKSNQLVRMGWLLFVVMV
eukprot:3948119-Amphidinium_carterae.1